MSNHFEMCFQNKSVLCICSKVSLQTLIRGGGAFTLVVSCYDGDGVSGGVAYIDVFVLL